MRQRNSIRIHSGLTLLILLTNLGATPLSVPLEEKGKKPEAFALLVGTCFNEKGLSLPGAKVIVELTSEPTVKLKKKKWEMVSSPRGEFAVRLPAGRYVFKVTATKNGFRRSEKTMSFEADERQDIVLSLEPDSGGQ
jgi:hypothetical protein